MIELRVDIVERSIGFLDVVVTALLDITCRTVRINSVVGDVCRIDAFPVDLSGLVVACFPQIYQRIVLSLINRRTYEVTVVTDKAGTERVTVGVFSDKHTPWVVVAVLVKQLLCAA